MPDAQAPFPSTPTKPKVEEVHIIWITAGLSCDGDSVSITAASQPSVEDVVLGDPLIAQGASAQPGTGV